MKQEAREALEQHYRHVYKDWDVRKRLLSGDSVKEAAQKTGVCEGEVKRVMRYIANVMGIMKPATN
jgi:hypothetical protein